MRTREVNLVKKSGLIIALALVLGQGAFAQSKDQAPAKQAEGQKDDLLNLDVMDLAKMQVTSASKKAESLFGVAAAISVVTAEDIKRTGAINIPEALRLVPGVQVAQTNGNKYAVTIRGFNSVYSDKLLVLIDGRSIYNNFWGGVFWEDQAISMEEIDRIEVIRGPGGTLWGANAVNGIINIITKKAKDTKGLSMTAGGATYGSFANGSIRYGGKLGNGDFRVSVLGLQDAGSIAKSGVENLDGRRANKFSFRYDGGSEKTGTIFLEGDIHKVDLAQQQNLPTLTAPYNVASNVGVSNIGGSFLAKFEKTLSDGSSNSLQASYDHNYHYIVPNLLDRDGTIDVQLQHSFKQLGNNNIITGAGFRTTADDYQNSIATVNPPTATTRVYSFFAQDQIQLSATTRLTAGTKVEHNDFSNWEVEPSARLSVQPDENHTWWASLSRAVRTPNRATSDLAFPDQGIPFPNGHGGYVPGEAVVKGDPTLKSTVMVAAETGYRLELNKQTTADVSLFQNSYTHLQNWTQGHYVLGLPVVVPVIMTDLGNATVRGFELSAKYQATDKLRFDFGYSYEVTDVANLVFDAPKHEIKELATYTFSPKLSFDQALYFAGASSDGNSSYHRLDLQLRYKPSANVDFSIGGRNLGQGRYNQLGNGTFSSGQLIQPAAFAQLTLKF